MVSTVGAFTRGRGLQAESLGAQRSLPERGHRSLRDAGGTGRLEGLLSGGHAGGESAHLEEEGSAQDGWVGRGDWGEVAKGTESLTVTLSPSGHLFLVFWDSQEKGM